MKTVEAGGGGTSRRSRRRQEGGRPGAPTGAGASRLPSGVPESGGLSPGGSRPTRRHLASGGGGGPQELVGGKDTRRPVGVCALSWWRALLSFWKKGLNSLLCFRSTACRSSPACAVLCLPRCTQLLAALPRPAVLCSSLPSRAALSRSRCVPSPPEGLSSLYSAAGSGTL